MRMKSAAILLAVLVGGAAVASAQTSVTAGAGGIFPAGTTFLGVSLKGLEVGSGVEIAATGPALGQFSSTLLGTSVLGAAQNIVVYGKATAGSRTVPNIATFSGTAIIDDGNLPTTGVPFTVTITADANDQGSIVLVLGNTRLPAAAINQGTITIK
jgi:hypothetical protein